MRKQQPKSYKIHLPEKEHRVETEIGLLGNLVKWFFQAKGTLLICVLIVAAYFYSTTLSEQAFKQLIFTRESFFQLNFLPMAAGWFLHANLAHLIGNLVALLVFGRIVERRFGTFKFFFIYFLAGIVSDLVASVLFGEIGIGASGAIYGLMATAMLINPFYITFSLYVPLPVVVVGWIYAFSNISGLIVPVLGDNTGYIAHLSGFFVVSLLVYMFTKHDQKIKRGMAINVLTVIILALLYYFYPDIVVDFLKRA